MPTPTPATVSTVVATTALLASLTGTGVAAPAANKAPAVSAQVAAAFEDLAHGLQDASHWLTRGPVGMGWLMPQSLVADICQAQLDLRNIAHRSTEWTAGVISRISDLPFDATIASLNEAMRSIAAPPPDLTPVIANPAPGRESSGFGWRDDPIHGNRRFHSGTDMRAPKGTPVHAAGDGVVIIAGRQHGYGTVIYLDHGGGIVTRYGHLSKIEVKKGDVIEAASEIGLVGATGRATGPHLHFEVRIDGHAVDPVLAMTVAGLERTSPDEARVLALGLDPDLQKHALDRDDRTNRRGQGHAEEPKSTRGKHRPERIGRARRDQNNW